MPRESACRAARSRPRAWRGSPRTPACRDGAASLEPAQLPGERVAARPADRPDPMRLAPDRLAVFSGQRDIDDERSVRTRLEGVRAARRRLLRRLARQLVRTADCVAGLGDVPPDLWLAGFGSCAVFRGPTWHSIDASTPL